MKLTHLTPLKTLPLAILLILALSQLPLLAQSPTFRDVPISHFAFEAVNWVSNPENGAFMVGDAANNFNPTRNLNKFEAAQIYAMAAGYRHSAATLSPAEQDILTRSFETWRPLLDDIAAEFTTWNRTVDREISYLLYRGIITPDEAKSFVSRTGTNETRELLTREEAVAWMVRLVGQAPHAQAVQFHTLFRDDAQISPQYRHYVYHAREIGIIHGSGGYMNPVAHFTRAEMATVFYNALSGPTPEQAAVTGSHSTITGTISNVFLDTHVTITSAAGTETFPIAQNAVLMIDNVQRTASFLRENMNVTVLVDANRQIISLVAREQAQSSSQQTAATPAVLDEGFVTAVSSAFNTVTIRTQRVRITGQVIDDERVFYHTPNTVITNGGLAAKFEDIQIGDIVFFSYSGANINTLEIMERERTLTGVLADVRPPDNQGAAPVVVIEENDGSLYEFRVLSVTEITRDENAVNWSDLRIGDRVTADVEHDRLARVSANGERTLVNGRLNEIRITERNTEISVTRDDGTTFNYIVRPGVYDVYSLRIGMSLRIQLDSREVISVQNQSNEQAQNVVLGFIQAVRADNTIVVVENQGTTTRTHTIAVPTGTPVTRSGVTMSTSELRVNMNVYIVTTAEGSNIARSVTVLP